MNRKFPLFGQDEIENSFMHLVDRSMREQRREERRLAVQRATKHRFQARKSCVADARSYRVARRLPVLAIAQFDGGTLNSLETARYALTP
ncbi:MAG TPA: hypothetical protein VN801_02895 [Candidatus Udaeobacter sp.]|jgi:hypothetical protein|nr:hypothetical protein [Candidatus Udaeobacter sp.]